MEPVLQLFNCTKMSLIRTATWTLSNLCRGKSPQPDWNIVSQAIPTLGKLIYSVDAETLVDACWAVSYLSDGTSEAIQAVIDARIPHRLVELLGHESTLVQTPALRAIGNIVTGSDYQTQIVINAGVLPALAPLLNSTKDTIRKEACWTISNITAGTTDQIQAVIDANLIPQVIRLLIHGDYKTKKEACWAISNASSGGLTKPDQIRYLVSQGCIKPLCDLLSVADSKIIEVTLDSLENILKMGEMDKEARNASVNEYALFIEEAGGMEKIFECQNNPNEKIYQKHLASLKSISLMTTVKSMTKTLFLKVTETHLVLGWTRINNNRTFSFRSGASFFFLFAVPFFYYKCIGFFFHRIYLSPLFFILLIYIQFLCKKMSRRVVGNHVILGINAVSIVVGLYGAWRIFLIELSDDLKGAGHYQFLTNLSLIYSLVVLD